MSGLRCAAFLDRDGVINEDRGYVHRLEDLAILPGVVTALRDLHAAGFLLIVVTNQSGIARGYFDERDLDRFHAALQDTLGQEQVRIDAFYHCPHLAGGAVAQFAVDCTCRKPMPGMIEAAAAAWEIDRAGSVLVGDKASDIEAGHTAGIGRLYRIGGPVRQEGKVFSGLANLRECVDHLLPRPDAPAAAAGER